MNGGFRNLLGGRDTSRFKAFLLAIAVQMLILPFLQFLGIIEFTVPGFYPLGATVGGFLFGLAMNWSGGCPAGIWYKAGGGSSSAFMAIIGLIIGYIATESGVLKTARVFLQSVGSSGIEAMTLSSLTRLPLWGIALPLSATIIIILLRNSNVSGNAENSWNWRTTGLWMGSIGVAAWIASSLSGRFFGMAILPGSKETFDLLILGNLAALNWDLFFVLGIPVGSYLAVARLGMFQWSNISGAAIWKLSCGGFLLGASTSLAGGCTVGHGLAGIPLLSLGSITFTVFAILGAWAGVLKKEISPKK